jgi:RimJ/RimL family protein N-acetyltransferase
MIASTGIQGTRVRLRALCRGDVELLRLYINDPDVMQFSNQFRPVGDMEQEDWYKSVLAAHDSVWFGIADKQQKEEALIGTCCLVGIDWISRSAELRIRLGDKSRWGKGNGSEATCLLLQYGFLDLNLERIWLRVFASNSRARQLYEKSGFKVEGTLRQATFIHGKADDVILMGLLRREWTESLNQKV